MKNVKALGKSFCQGLIFLNKNQFSHFHTSQVLVVFIQICVSEISAFIPAQWRWLLYPDWPHTECVGLGVLTHTSMMNVGDITCEYELRVTSSTFRTGLKQHFSKTSSTPNQMGLLHLTRDNASTEKHGVATCPSANTNTTLKSREKHAFFYRKSICTKMGGEMGRPVGGKKEDSRCVAYHVCMVW